MLPVIDSILKVGKSHSREGRSDDNCLSAVIAVNFFLSLSAEAPL